MRLNRGVVALPLLFFLAAACGGNPPPEPPPVVEEAPPEPNADSLAAVRAAERAAAAAKLCQEAEAAMAGANYERARSLYRKAMEEYSGTDCANQAGDMIARIDAIQTIRERVHFDFDKSNIRDDAAEVLQRKAEVLQKYPNLRLTIEGHCDERGSLEYNQALGQRRAESAKRYLVSLGVPETMFRTVSYGEERPIAQGHDEQAWAQNRRAEFVIENMDAL